MHMQVGETLFIKESGSSGSNPFICVLSWNFGALFIRSEIILCSYIFLSSCPSFSVVTNGD